MSIFSGLGQIYIRPGYVSEWIEVNHYQINKRYAKVLQNLKMFGTSLAKIPMDLGMRV